MEIGDRIASEKDCQKPAGNSRRLRETERERERQRERESFCSCNVPNV